MLNLTKAVFDVLISNPDVTNFLSKYNGRPAVFTSDTAPKDAKFPLILASDSVTDDPTETTKTHIRREIVRDIRIYDTSHARGGKPRGTKEINQIAEAVRAQFDRKVDLLIDPEWTFSRVNIVSGPNRVDSPDHYGRVISVSFWVERNDLRLDEIRN